MVGGRNIMYFVAVAAFGFTLVGVAREATMKLAHLHGEKVAKSLRGKPMLVAEARLIFQGNFWQGHSRRVWMPERLADYRTVGVGAVVLFLHALMQVSSWGEAKHAADPDLYGTLRLGYAYACLFHAIGLVFLWSIKNVRGVSHHVHTCRPVVFILWAIWFCTFCIMRSGFSSMSHSGFQVIDCAAEATASAERSISAKASLTQLAQVQSGVAATGASIPQFATLGLQQHLLAADSKPWLCIAMTLPEKGNNVTTSLGSLLDGLHAEDLTQIRVKVFTSAAKSSQDPVLQAAAAGSGSVIQVLPRPVANSAEAANEAKRRDYTAALTACNAEGLPYALVLQDDVVPAKHMLQSISRSVQDLERSSGGQWRQLQLFVSERFQAWGPLLSTPSNFVWLFVFPVLVGALASAAALAVVRPITGQKPFAMVVFMSTFALAVFIVVAAGRPNLVRTFSSGLSEQAATLQNCVAPQVAVLHPLRSISGLLSSQLTAGPGSSMVGAEAACKYAAELGSSWLYQPSAFQHPGHAAVCAQ